VSDIEQRNNMLGWEEGFVFACLLKSCCTQYILLHNIVAAA
jgi:hypothetical protein